MGKGSHYGLENSLFGDKDFDASTCNDIPVEFMKKLANLSHNPLLFEPIAAISDATVHQILLGSKVCRYPNFLIKKPHLWPLP